MVGAVVFFVARDLIGAITTGWTLWFGLLFVVVVMFKPEGIAGMFTSLRRRVAKKSAAPLAPASPQLQAR